MVPELRIDLHAHTTASDGSDTPTELVDAALGVVDVLGLTDHDTTSGWTEALSRAAETGVGLVPGIELSAQILDHEGGEPPLSVHVTGYLVDPRDTALVAEGERIRSHREHRLELIVERLSRDLDITWEEVAARIPPGATPGRPHVADVLVDKGIVASVSDAFSHFLAAHGPYHVPHYAPRLASALATIRHAGGVPVLAHPLSGSRRHAVAGEDEASLLATLSPLMDQGLAGVEVFHRENAPGLVPLLEKAARKLGLIVVGSSDYHGSKKPNRLGEHLTGEEDFAAIVEAGSGVEPYLPATLGR